LAAKAHRHRRLAAAAELHEPQLRPIRDQQAIQLLGVAVRHIAVRLEALRERVAERHVVISWTIVGARGGRQRGSRRRYDRAEHRDD
jgi:hypothetical protein